MMSVVVTTQIAVARQNGIDSLVTIGFKELLVIAGIVGFFVWIRMFRNTMEENTTTFFKRLKGPDSGGRGFGWRGMLTAFVIGIAFCCVLVYMVLRVWFFYHPVGATGP